MIYKDQNENLLRVFWDFPRYFFTTFQHCIAILIALSLQAAHGQSVTPIFTAKNAEIHLFSTTPIENIDAAARDAVSVLDSKTKTIIFHVKIRSFVFSHALMQEHFNENYLESEKYPLATFKGIIQELVDFSKAGGYDVSVKGILTVHGISSLRTITGKLNIQPGGLDLSASFDVACNDHHIRIPTLVITKVAETIRITVKGHYTQPK